VYKAPGERSHGISEEAGALPGELWVCPDPVIREYSTAQYQVS